MSEFGGNWYFRGFCLFGSGFGVFGILILISVWLRLGFDVLVIVGLLFGIVTVLPFDLGFELVWVVIRVLVLRVV